MKKTAILAIGLLALGACTSPKAVTYRPKGSESAPYVITTKVNQITNNVQLFIDGKKVIDGHASMWDGTGQFFGVHEGHKVHLDCGPNVIGCRVLIDNELAGEI